MAEVMTATLERLKRDRFSNLQRFLDQQQRLGVETAQSFDAWLYGAVDYAVREYVRKRYGRAPRGALGEGAPRLSKRDVSTNASRLPTGVDVPWEARLPGVTTRLTLGQIFRIVAEEFSSDEARALQLFYGEDRPFSEIASELGLEDAHAADKLIRRLNARLRYRFGSCA